MNTPLLREDSFAEEMLRVRKTLKALRTAGTFERRAGESIYFELYRAKQAKGWVAISHGFTEGIPKYTEMIWYFLQEGWSVAICDHRGHGRSFRQVEQLWLTHVDRFQDYVEDFASFLRHVVEPKREGLPLAVLGHSMGGAIAVHLVQRHPTLGVEKLVLCSPMVAPATGEHSRSAVGALSRMFCLRGRGKECNFAQKPYDGADEFDEPWCCATSYARYHWYLDYRRSHERYQNSAATYQWLREAIAQTRPMLRRSNTRRVKIPVLLLQAGKETMVDNEMEDLLVGRLPNARKLLFPDARHEIYQCSNDEVERFMDEVLEFIGED